MSDLALSAITVEGDNMVGYLAVADCPSIGKEGCLTWVDSRLQEFMPDFNGFNTMFINFLLLDERRLMIWTRLDLICCTMPLRSVRYGLYCMDVSK